MKFTQGLVSGAILTLVGVGALYISGAFDGVFSDNGAVSERADTVTGEKEILYWVAPMDPGYRRDGPGKSPMGMDLIPVYKGEEQSGYDGVEIDPRLVAAIGVKTAPVRRETLTPEITTIGQFTYDERRMEHVHVRAAGWVEELYVRAVGEPVREGQPLFDVYAPELLAAQADYIQAMETGQKQYLDGAVERLRGLGLTAEDISALKGRNSLKPLLTIRAPRAGVVHNMNISDGDRINVGEPAMSIAELSPMWLIANVFEADTRYVKQGAAVSFAPMDGGEAVTAKVDYIYPTLDTVTRTSRVRIVVENPDAQFLNGMYARVKIARAPLERVLTVPASAVIRLGHGAHVLVAQGDGRFRPTEVALGDEVGERMVITDGLTEGDEVVVRGQFMIDSESSFQGAKMRMLGDADGAASDIDMVEGTINAVDLDARKLTITHGPMEAFGMMGMTMDFPVAEGVGLDERLEGVRVRFTVKREGMRFTVIRLDVLEAAP
ncbi:efflux RND transporter periplasmic adaptor subunit [Kordiimonas sp.]|uniref:efflux RND transporter periplasmic adaptor subunit n=1 Tax=Kordiimonas sp. TaxID=1970157 RepID=UPI003A90E164